MEQELVSIIVPVYKVERFLHKCLNSIKRQTYKNIEVTLVDDGSPDKCPQICDEYANGDARFKVVHKPNGGLASARNAGLDFIMERPGDYVMFVDSDDWLPRNAVEILVKKQKENDADWTLGSFKIMYPIRTVKNCFTEACFHKKETEKFQALMNGNVISTCARLYRSKLIYEHNVRFDSTMLAAEDSFFNYRYIQYCETFATTERIVYYYSKLNETSLTHAFVPARDLYYKINLTERRKIFSDEIKPDKAAEDNYVHSRFIMHCTSYVRCLPREAAIAKIKETHEMYLDAGLLDCTDTEEGQGASMKYDATKVYLKCKPFLDGKNYGRVYDYFYVRAKDDRSLQGNVKKSIKSVMGKIRLFYFFKLRH